MLPRLMVPGPVEISDAVRAALAGPVRAHYGQEWTAIHNETLGLLRQVMQTTGRVFVLAGSGNSANEAVINSILRPGEKVVVGINGMFGDRLSEMVMACGGEPVAVKADLGTPLSADDFARTLQRHPDASLVAIVHLETSTGVLNPLPGIAQAARAAGIPVMVDAVSSLGGTELPMDEWGIDICATASQKCLSAPPGLSVVAISEKAWTRMVRPGCRGWYLNLNVWQHYADEWADWHPFPVTMPTSVFMALRAALQELLAEGLANRIRRYRTLADRLRRGLCELGMQPVVAPEYMSPVLTAARVPAGVASGEIVNYVIKNHNIQITRGFGALRDRVCRIGHMGSEINAELVDSLLAGLRAFWLSRR